jgi:hypothetical protein
LVPESAVRPPHRRPAVGPPGRRPDDLLVYADGRPHRRPAVGPPARRRSLSGSDPVAPTVFIGGGGIDENVKRGVAERLDDAREAVVGERRI